MITASEGCSHEMVNSSSLTNTRQADIPATETFAQSDILVHCADVPWDWVHLFSPADGHHVSQHTKHLVEAGAFVDALDDGCQEVYGQDGDGRPRHALVLPLQHAVEGASCGGKHHHCNTYQGNFTRGNELWGQTP